MATIDGNRNNNTLTGDDAADVISGFGGDDTLSGERGSDALGGFVGDDVLSGGDGSDVLNGGAGNDIIYGAGGSGGTATYWQSAEAGRIDANLLTSNVNRPVYAAAAPGDAQHLFVAELKSGKIQVVDISTGTVSLAPLLDLADARLGASGEQGLIGFAFHPDYETNGYIYVSFLNANSDTEIVRFTRSENNPLRVDPASETAVWTFPRHPTATNHGGGWIEFGPDGYLYLASGDGGPGRDPNDEAQNPDSLLGKIHRIDINGDDFPADPLRNYAIPDDNPFASGGGAPEIWAIGLRHPWRNSFDAATGDLYIADVGQVQQEEVNFQAAGSAGGANYGWVIREGELVFDDTRPGNLPADDPSLIDPVHVYGRDQGVSITGGYVHRGPTAGLEGFYVYGDFGSDRIAAFRVENGAAVDYTDLNDRIIVDEARILSIVSFAQDSALNQYVLSLTGRIYALTPSAGSADGNDNLLGGAGDDALYGNAGDDRLTGHEDHDLLSGGLGNDVLAGNNGLDVLLGGMGNDRLFAGDGDDVLIGDAGNDRLVGSTGADSLAGGAGLDDLFGGAGSDTFVYNRGDEADRLLDFESGLDVIDLRNFGFATIEEVLAQGRQTSNGNVFFDFGGGDTLTVSNTSLLLIEESLWI